VLRPLTDDDLPAIEAWWPEAAAVVHGTTHPLPLEELRQTTADAEAFVIAASDDPSPIGLLVYALTLDGWLEFRFVAIAAGKRGWGHGSEAVILVEGAGVADRFAADVHEGNGLGVYFWTRIGYRPAAPGEVSWRSPDDLGVMTFVRVPAESGHLRPQGGH
jgi:hypothetical protein